MELKNNTTTPQPTGRPHILSLLCILTFIWSGFNFLGHFYIYLIFDSLDQIIAEAAQIYPPEALELFTRAPRSFFLTNFVFNAGSFAGAFLMWHLKKLGFHVYAASQIFLIAIPTLSGVLPLTAGAVLSTLLFVILYQRNLAYMK